MRTRLAAARVFADEVSYKGFMASGNKQESEDVLNVLPQKMEVEIP